jgi:hypothetical protein
LVATGGLDLGGTLAAGDRPLRILLVAAMTPSKRGFRMARFGLAGSVFSTKGAVGLAASIFSVPCVGTEFPDVLFLAGTSAGFLFMTAIPCFYLRFLILPEWNLTLSIRQMQP